MNIERIQNGFNSLETILNSRSGELISRNAQLILSICRDLKVQSAAYKHELDKLKAQSDDRLRNVSIRIPTVQKNLSDLLSAISRLQESIVRKLEDNAAAGNPDNATVIQFMQNELNSYKRMFIECYRYFLLV
ncbi:MAG: hypothetical protein NC311_16935 [Muribaculaceae bacterium]|nr:hypothetical protein [Muribaculaceae bacterium]